jgi:hypothetical protein
VVSVAGTNFTSIVDWLSEDVNVFPTNRVAWSDFNPINLSQLTPSAHALIDAGTVLGVTNLLTQLADASQPANSQSLGGFLLNLPDSPGFQTGATLYFSGHSLGGALTQVLPLYLNAALAAVNQGESGKAVWGTVYVLPTAGPTPGNVAFAELFNNTFPGDVETGFAPVPYWNNDVISKLDVVPAAWDNIQNAFSATADAKGNYSSFYGMLGDDAANIVIPIFNIDLQSVPFGKGMGEMSAVLGTYAIFYTPVRQIAFQPTQGYYAWADGVGTWTPYTLPSDTDPLESLDALAPYVLYTHTSQYAYYFLDGTIPHPPSLQKSS